MGCNNELTTQSYIGNTTLVGYERALMDATRCNTSGSNCIGRRASSCTVGICGGCSGGGGGGGGTCCPCGCRAVGFGQAASFSCCSSCSLAQAFRRATSAVAAGLSRNSGGGRPPVFHSLKVESQMTQTG